MYRVSMKTLELGKSLTGPMSMLLIFFYSFSIDTINIMSTDGCTH